MLIRAEIDGYRNSWKDQMISYDGQSFTYDAYGVLSRIYYINGNNTNYYYPGVNSRGDVEYIYNINGELVTRYIYDSWRKLIELQNHTTSADHIGNVNSVRYRGYYYDQETGLYYVGSRYYDPEVGRWINADDVVSDIGGEVLGYNLSDYCYNNQIMFSDSKGHFPRPHRPSEYVGGSLISGLNTASSIINKAKEDFINFNIYNESEEKVLNSNYFAMYKGAPVIITPFIHHFHLV